MDKKPSEKFLDIIQRGYYFGLLIRYNEAFISPDFTQKCDLPSLPKSGVDVVYLFPRNFRPLESKDHGNQNLNLNLNLYTTLVSLHDAKREELKPLWRWTGRFPSQEEAVSHLVERVYSLSLENQYSSALRERNSKAEELLGLENTIGLVAIRHWQTTLWEELMAKSVPLQPFEGFKKQQ